MKTFPLFNDKTRNQYGFEIENAYIFTANIIKILDSINGITDIEQVGKSFFSETDVRIRFNYFGRGCSIIEPFGDNSRYLISPDTPSEASSDIKNIENFFKDYKPPGWQKIIGDLLTLRPLSWLWKNDH